MPLPDHKGQGSLDSGHISSFLKSQTLTKLIGTRPCWVRTRNNSFHPSRYSRHSEEPYHLGLSLFAERYARVLCLAPWRLDKRIARRSSSPFATLLPSANNFILGSRLTVWPAHWVESQFLATCFSSGRWSPNSWHGGTCLNRP